MQGHEAHCLHLQIIEGSDKTAVEPVFFCVEPVKLETRCNNMYFLQPRWKAHTCLSLDLHWDFCPFLIGEANISSSCLCRGSLFLVCLRSTTFVHLHNTRDMSIDLFPLVLLAEWRGIVHGDAENLPRLLKDQKSEDWKKPARQVVLLP